jgi:rubredoxin
VRQLTGLQSFETLSEEIIMADYACGICGFVYHQDQGDLIGDVAPGTPFAEVSQNWTCPICGAGKDQFVPVS